MASVDGPDRRTGSAPADAALECECGYRAVGSDPREQVVDAQRHALDAHGILMTTDLLLACLQSARGRQDPPEAAPA